MGWNIISLIEHESSRDWTLLLVACTTSLPSHPNHSVVVGEAGGKMCLFLKRKCCVGLKLLCLQHGYCHLMLTPAIARWFLYGGTDALNVESLLSDREGSWPQKATSVHPTKWAGSRKSNEICSLFALLTNMKYLCARTMQDIIILNTGAAAGVFLSEAVPSPPREST